MIARARDWLRRQRSAATERRETVRAVLGDPAFGAALVELADREGLAIADAEERAERIMRGLVTVNSPALPDLNVALAHIVDRDAFEHRLAYDRAAADRIAELGDRVSTALLTGHRSYYDFLVRVPLARRGSPREYRFAGANTAVGLAMPLTRNAGIVFVRRSGSGKDPVYNLVLRSYVGWLTEQRANFFWTPEGTRTRTGKLGRLKTGLLAYLVDGFLAGDAHDVVLVPANIVYEYLDEALEFGRYGRGESKKAESVTLIPRLAFTHRRSPEHALVHIGYGEPLSLAEFVTPAMRVDEDRLTEAVGLVADEVGRRIAAATPVTGVALVLLPLMERAGTSLTVAELVDAVAPVMAIVRGEGHPAFEVGLGDEPTVRRALSLLGAQGIVIEDGAGSRTRYRVDPDRFIEAAFYRNGIVHHFLVRSLVETALAVVAGSGAGFVETLRELRGLVAHEFHLPSGAAFDVAVASILTPMDLDWEDKTRSKASAALLLDGIRPHVAPWVLAPSLASDLLVAEGLCRLDDAAVDDERGFLLDVRRRAASTDVGAARPDAASLNALEDGLELMRRWAVLASATGHARVSGRDRLRATLATVDSLPSATSAPE